ncbi:MAG TPA: MOSC domain-containing protein [Thermoanaerobaculia bacterium]|jgi:MOSC domain-containing protein YiiM
MKIETVSVGAPSAVRWKGREVVTSIFKSPVAGPVRIRRNNLDGDRQADLEVHGGEYKAVYAYAAENYDWWSTALGRPLEPANFGENLTVRGFEEETIHIGDVFRAGDAELEATEPRLPCYKLGIRFGDPRMVETFASGRRWGIYFRVVTEGELQTGDVVERIHADPAAIPVYDVARVYVFDRQDIGTMERLAAHPRLDPAWKEHFVERLESRKAGSKR